jgi:hypothetical protein
LAFNVASKLQRELESNYKSLRFICGLKGIFEKTADRDRGAASALCLGDAMSRKVTRLVHAGKYVAGVAVESIPDDGAWGPYLSLDDALELERVERALRSGDLKAASQDSRVYEMTPVAAESMHQRL